MSAITKTGAAWKKFWQKNKRGKLLIISVLGTLVFLLSAWELAVTFEIDPFIDMEIPGLAELDDIAWLTLGIGGIVMIAGWLYYHDHSKNFKRFNELIDTDSKAQFVRNIDEIEDLAVQLGPDFERQVIDRRKEFHVKTR
ncbi:MAG: DUF3198 domain-containing protein [Candidatus Thermoplasmatota archaeon]|nr:DUF3198 domain-containing protein [Candidatus Thermoplasmatota archaeon]